MAKDTIKQMTARMKNLEIMKLTNMITQLEKVEVVNVYDKKYREHALYYLTQMIYQRKRKLGVKGD